MPEARDILIISFSPLDRDPRVRRQILFLKDHYRVVAAGLTDPEIQGVGYYPITRAGRSLFRLGLGVLRLRMRQFEQFYWSSAIVQGALRSLSSERCDVIIANDLNTLPLALFLAKKTGAKVLLDAHEYEPGHFDDRWKFRLLFQRYSDYICRRYLPQVDAMVTVCQGIAEEYKRDYGVSCEVITNAPFYHKLAPSAVRNERIRVIHHGGTNRSRRPENMVFLMDHLDRRFTLDFMLVNNDSRIYRRLEHLAQNRPRVRFHDPVAFSNIVQTLNRYDIGLHLLPPNNFNHRMSLPNKLFEFIQARLAVAIWPSPEMARVVRQHRCGLVSKGFTIESIATALNALSSRDIALFKQQSHKAASFLSAEANRDIFVNVLRRLLGSRRVQRIYEEANSLQHKTKGAEL